MRVKKIRIKTKDEFYDGLLKGEFFESLEAVRNVLTEKRLELWRLIRDETPGSILELSKLAKRNFKSVYQDVAMLVAVGLVELKKEKGKRGDTQRPVSLADTLQLEVA
jgi:predicted transcriptional regulator